MFKAECFGGAEVKVIEGARKEDQERITCIELTNVEWKSHEVKAPRAFRADTSPLLDDM